MGKRNKFRKYGAAHMKKRDRKKRMRRFLEDLDGGFMFIAGDENLEGLDIAKMTKDEKMELVKQGKGTYFPTQEEWHERNLREHPNVEDALIDSLLVIGKKQKEEANRKRACVLTSLGIDDEESVSSLRRNTPFDEGIHVELLDNLEHNATNTGLRPDSPWFDRDRMRLVGDRLAGIAVTSNKDACLLWLYDHGSDICEDVDHGKGRFVLALTPDMMRSAKSCDKELREAIKTVMKRVPIIYDERAKEGYPNRIVYEKVGSGEHVRYIERTELLDKDGNIVDVNKLHPEFEFHQGVGAYDFLASCMASHYDISFPRRKTRESKERDTKSAGCAYRRMFDGCGLQIMCSMPCLDEGDRDFLRDIMDKVSSKTLVFSQLARKFGAIKSEECHEGDALSEEVRMHRIIRIANDAFVAWDASRETSEKEIIEAMEEERSDEELADLFARQQENSGNVALVREAYETGANIWELLKRECVRTDRNNV